MEKNTQRVRTWVFRAWLAAGLSLPGALLAQSSLVDITGAPGIKETLTISSPKPAVFKSLVVPAYRGELLWQTSPDAMAVQQRGTLNDLYQVLFKLQRLQQLAPQIDRQALKAQMMARIAPRDQSTGRTRNRSAGESAEAEADRHITYLAQVLLTDSAFRGYFCNSQNVCSPDRQGFWGGGSQRTNNHGDPRYSIDVGGAAAGAAIDKFVDGELNVLLSMAAEAAKRQRSLYYAGEITLSTYDFGRGGYDVRGHTDLRSAYFSHVAGDNPRGTLGQAGKRSLFGEFYRVDEAAAQKMSEATRANFNKIYVVYPLTLTPMSAIRSPEAGEQWQQTHTHELRTAKATFFYDVALTRKAFELPQP
jgi:hypothetical protein